MTHLTENSLFANRYRLISMLGLGGYSEVWKAEDQMSDNMIIALKIFAPGRGLDSDGIKIFSKEYSAVFNFHHIGLLKASHYDICDGSPYLVLSYCKNGSALKLIGEVDEQGLARFMQQSASALAYLHSHEPSVIHQDIKPDNFLIDDDGDYLLSDFGISSKIRRTLTKSMGEKVSSGTMAYMPPEKFSADKQIIKAGDIFSLGVTMYELLTGDLPFGDNGGLTLKSGADIPNLPIGFSSKLNEILLSCMAKHPDERPTAMELENLATGYLKTGTWSYEKTTDKNFKKSRPTEPIIQSTKNENNKNIEPVKVKKTTHKKLVFRPIFYIPVISFILLIFIIALSANMSRNKNEKYLLNYSKAISHLEVARYDSAEYYFKRAGEFKKTDSLNSKIQILSYLIPAIKDYYDAKYTSALQKFEQAASLGSGDANYYMGELYYNGMGTKMNYKEGFKHTNEAVKKGFKMAWWRIATVYGQGYGMKVNKDSAAKYYLACTDAVKRLAEAGDLEALGNLGWMYRNGEGVSVNKKLGLEYFVKSAKNGYVFMQSGLASIYLTGDDTEKNVEEGIRLTRIAAEKGHPTAQITLGDLYLEGKNLSKDISLGLEWIQKAADQNDASAWNHLGMIYFNGTNVKMDKEKAFRCFKKAVECSMDYSSGIISLAYCYREGFGTEKSYSEAKNVYEQAIANDTSTGRIYNYKISLLYKTGGPGITKDLDKYKKYCKLAALAGNGEASNSLGCYYYLTENDNEKATKWLQLGIDQGDDQAKENLDYVKKSRTGKKTSNYYGRKK